MNDYHHILMQMLAETETNEQRQHFVMAASFAIAAAMVSVSDDAARAQLIQVINQSIIDTTADLHADFIKSMPDGMRMH